MRLDVLRSGSLRRVLCALLCISLVFSALFLSACNNEEIATPPQEVDVDATVELLRLVKDVEYGEKLTAAKFETVSVKLSQACVGALGNADEVIGKYATINMSAGDYLLAKYLSDKKLAPAEQDAEFSRTNYGFEKLGYIVVTEFVQPNTGEDIGVELQAIIDKNPQSVIYFPDGEYQTSIPLRTPAHGSVSIALELSENAVIKAHKDWNRNNGAVIHLGGQRETGEVNTPGSNYYMRGGIVDGSGVANGVSIDCGRETSLREVTIINTNIGVHVFRGSKLGNGSSSDSDVDKITVFGNGSETSIGLFVDGYDNTVSNMRIANVRTGVRITSQANLLHNIQCVAPSEAMSATSYKQSVGFNDQGARNWYENCTSTNFSTGFLIDSKSSFLTNCIARWTDEVSELGDQIALRSTQKWNAMTKSVVAEFSAPAAKCYYIVALVDGGDGKVIDPVFDVSAVNQESYNKHKNLISGKIMWNE